MTKNATADNGSATEASALAEAVAESVPASLVEFCTRLSMTVSRPELIGAFEYHERVAGRVSATDAEFQSRYADFINKPV